MSTRRPKRGDSRRTPPARAQALGFEHPVVASAGLVALVVFVFHAVGHFPFISLDDPVYVTANPTVEAGLSWSNVGWAFTTGHAPYWHPVTWLSHMLDVDLFGLEAGRHHLTNVMFHAANTVLLFAWLRRTTGAVWRALFVAAVFAVHPLHVESVTWITERKDMLSAFFWLLTLWAYAAYAARPSRVSYGIALGTLMLGLMSKPSVVTLPFVLLLVDVWPLRRLTWSDGWSRWRGRIVEKLPFVALAAATSVVTIAIQARVGAVSDLGTLPLAARLTNAGVDYLLYLGKTVWPVDLAVFYPLYRWSVGAGLAAAAALAMVTVAAARVRERAPYVLVGWLWFLLTLLPMIGLVQVGAQAIADRFMYIPMIGLLLVVSWGLPDLAARVPRWATPRLIGALAATLVVILAVMAESLTSSWSTEATLWRHAIESTQGNYLAEVNLGSALMADGAVDEALRNYRAALEVVPASWPAQRASIHTDVGLALLRQGKAAESLAELAEASRLDPDLAAAHRTAGDALEQLGRLPEAVEAFRTAVRLEPDSVDALVGLGEALLSENQPAAAIPFLAQAAHDGPDVAGIHDALGSALAMDGRREEAHAEFETALRLKPDLAPALVNLGVLDLSEGRWAEAAQNAEKALLIDPTSESARHLLASAGKGHL
jgi:tetratricopeptide (TPR) repeat protein